jgi:general secretion pathway protein F
VRTFEYKGYEASGAAARGLVEAESVKEARAQLAARGVFAENLTPAGSPAVGGGRLRSFHRASVRSAIYRETASLLRAGFPLTRTLDFLIESPEFRSSRGLLAGVRDRIKEGTDPVRALTEAGGLSPFETAVLDAGRRAGALDAGFDRAAAHLEEAGRIRDRLLSAALYPAVVGILAFGVAGLLLGGLLPSFAKVWTEAGVQLPWITRFFLAAGRGLRWGAPVLVLLCGALWIRLRRRPLSPGTRLALDRRSYRLPGIGRARCALTSMRFARTVHLLLESGVQLLEALDLAGRASGSPWVESLVAGELDAIRHGGRVSDSLRRIPPLAAHLPGWVEAGEVGGDLSGLLQSAATRASEVWDRLLARGLSLIEPALFVLLGGFVFLIALAVWLPLLALSRGIGL